MSTFDTLLGQTRGSTALLQENSNDDERKEFDAANPVDLSAARRRGPPPPVSDNAVNLIIMFEVSSAAVYEARYRHPVWPKGQSGVTFAIGYDCGYVTGDQLSGDWLDTIGQAMVDTLKPVCGVKGTAAQQALHSVQSVDVPFDAAIKVFRSTTLDETVRKTVRALPNATALTPDCLGALVSLVYNRGASFSRPEDRYREMRAIASDVENNRFGDIPAQLRSMKRLWENDPNMAGLVRRRELEALLFEQGLK